MSQFDPYLNWLGIPAHEQPPNFYRLLGIVLFESSPRVIEQAADRQSLTVGAYQASPYGELCQRLLGEIAMARFNLLDPQQKAGYDAYLQETLAHRGERAVAAPPPPYVPPIVSVGGPMPTRGAGALPLLMQPTPPQPIMPQIPQPAMFQGATFMPLAQPAPAAPIFSPLQQSPQFGNPPMTPGTPSYPLPMPAPPANQPVMPIPAVRPAVVPVAAPFPVAARTAASGGGSSPAAPPTVPPAAPLRPLDELERLTSQPTSRRRFAKKRRKADYGKEIMVGGIVAAAGALLVVVYLAAQGNRGTGLDGISDNGRASHTSLAPRSPVEKSKSEKKPSAVAAEPHKEDAPPKPAQAAAPHRKAPAPSDEGEFRITIPAAGTGPALSP